MGEVLSVVLPAVSVVGILALWDKRLEERARAFFYKRMAKGCEETSSVFIDPRD